MCAFSVGIPMDIQSFDEDLERQDKDFARRIGSREAVEPLLVLLQTVLSAIRSTGVSVIAATKRTIVDQLTSRIEALTIYTHWDESTNRLELADGLVSVDEFIDLIPPSYSGLLDLTACGPIPIRDQMIRLRPNCRCKSSEKPVNAYIALWVYLVLYKRLAERPASYVDALAATLRAFEGDCNGPDRRNSKRY